MAVRTVGQAMPVCDFSALPRSLEDLERCGYSRLFEHEPIDTPENRMNLATYRTLADWVFHGQKPFHEIAFKVINQLRITDFHRIQHLMHYVFNDNIYNFYFQFTASELFCLGY